MSVSTVDDVVRIPAGITNLDSFRSWAKSDTFPDRPRISYLRGTIRVEMMSRMVEEAVRIPAGIIDLESFRRWARSDDFPKKVRVTYLDGEIWLDPSMEQAFTHNQVKTQFTIVLGGLAESTKLGRFYADGMRLSIAIVGESGEPDGMYMSYDTIRSGRIRRVEGSGDGCIEFEGAPDMVLEVVSDSSVEKDSVTLPLRYAQAGIPEYWLVDARIEAVRFDIFRLEADGYSTTRRQAGGWLKSHVFGRSFRLTRTADPVGDPLFTLDHRP